ncbi:MAG TPA: XisI protein [Coleofasciculaceae cyanobacterium]
MAKLDQYRHCIQALLRKYADGNELNPGEVESELIVDTEHDHYQLVDVGWHQLERIYSCVMHFDIKDGKIWIQQNMTEIDVAQELVEMGVCPADIVLGLQAPYKRQYTGYGVG